MIYPTQRPMQQHHPADNWLPPSREINKPKSNIQQMIQKFSSPGSVTSLTNRGVNGLSKTLTNVEQVLKVVQSAAPIVQEYGPMVKNLPAMYRMMKAIKDMDNENIDESGEPEINFTSDTTKKGEAQQEEMGHGQPAPKLYI